MRFLSELSIRRTHINAEPCREMDPKALPFNGQHVLLLLASLRIMKFKQLGVEDRNCAIRDPRSKKKPTPALGSVTGKN
jgi:hypothetical protein